MEVAPAFVDETGVLSTSVQEQPVYGIGLLVVHDPAPVTDSLYNLHFSFRSNRTEWRNQIRRNIRQEGRYLTLDELDHLMWSTRHHEYKFSEVTHHNLQQYVDLLNLYFSFPNVEFHALLIDRTQPEFDLAKWGNDIWLAYVELARELLKRRLQRPVFAIVDLQGQPKDASIRLEDRICSLPQVAGCIRATSDMLIFLQIVDVMLGCVQFDWKDQLGFYGKNSLRAGAKRDLANFMRTKMGLPTGKPILSPSKTFWKTTTPSVFTAWLYKASAAMSGVHPA